MFLTVKSFCVSWRYTRSIHHENLSVGNQKLKSIESWKGIWGYFSNSVEFPSYFTILLRTIRMFLTVKSFCFQQRFTRSIHNQSLRYTRSIDNENLSVGNQKLKSIESWKGTGGYFSNSVESWSGICLIFHDSFKDEGNVFNS